MGMWFDSAAAGDVLGAMITPAVLISASGTLVLSTTNRLGRVVDRVRVLVGQAEELPPPQEAQPEDVEKRELIADQVRRQAERVTLLQSAVTAFYVAIGLLVACSLSVGITAVSKYAFGWVPVGLGLLGALSLFFGAVVLVHEARLAVRSTLAELDYIKRVVARRTGKEPPGPEISGDSDRRAG